MSRAEDITDKNLEKFSNVLFDKLKRSIDKSTVKLEETLNKEIDLKLRRSINKSTVKLKETLNKEVDLKVNKSVLSQLNARYSALISHIAMLTLVTGIFFYISNSNKNDIQKNNAELKADIRNLIAVVLKNKN